MCCHLPFPQLSVLRISIYWNLTLPQWTKKIFSAHVKGNILFLLLVPPSPPLFLLPSPPSFPSHPLLPSSHFSSPCSSSLSFLLPPPLLLLPYPPSFPSPLLLPSPFPPLVLPPPHFSFLVPYSSFLISFLPFSSPPSFPSFLLLFPPLFLPPLLFPYSSLIPPSLSPSFPSPPFLLPPFLLLFPPLVFPPPAFSFLLLFHHSSSLYSSFLLLLHPFSFINLLFSSPHSYTHIFFLTLSPIFFISPYSIPFPRQWPSSLRYSPNITSIIRTEEDLKYNEGVSFSPKFQHGKSRDRVWYISYTEIFKNLLGFQHFPSTMEQWHCHR